MAKCIFKNELNKDATGAKIAQVQNVSELIQMTNKLLSCVKVRK